MVKYKLIILTIFTFAIHASSLKYHNAIKDQDKNNYKPIIGIYSIPHKQNDEKYYQSIIPSSYIKFIEMAGGRVVPISYHSSRNTLDRLLEGLNGLLLTGGNVRYSKQSLFYQNAQYLFDKSKQINNNGEHFPVYGICLGFELMHQIVANNSDNILKAIDHEINQSRQLINIDEDSILFKQMPLYLRNHAQNHKAFYFHHKNAITDETYQQYQVLDRFFKRTSYSYNTDRDQFISTVEARHYPFFGSQFHPEKNCFEWKIEACRQRKTIELTQYIANFLVQQSSLNQRRYLNSSFEIRNLIWNYFTTPVPSKSYMEVYVLHNNICDDEDENQQEEEYQIQNNQHLISQIELD